MSARKDTAVLEKLRSASQVLDRGALDMAAFFEYGPDLFAIADREHLLRVNPAWEAILGIATAELVGTSWLELVHPADRAKTREAAELMSREDVIFHHRLCRADGAYVPVSWRATPWNGRGVTYAVGRVLLEEKDGR